MFFFCINLLINSLSVVTLYMFCICSYAAITIACINCFSMIWHKFAIHLYRGRVKVTHPPGGRFSFVLKSNILYNMAPLALTLWRTILHPHNPSILTHSFAGFRQRLVAMQQISNLNRASSHGNEAPPPCCCCWLNKHQQDIQQHL